MTKHRILVATDLTPESLSIFDAADDIEIEVISPKTSNIREGLKSANVIITRDDVILDQALIEDAPNLRIIARISANISKVDMRVATVNGILVMNTPGVGAIAAGEHTMALMLALSRNLAMVHNSIREGWWLLNRGQQAGTQLYGKQLGIVGLGRVGRLVAQRALSFGMKIVACDPYIREDQVPDNRIALVGFKELLQTSDFITIHVPATEETYDLIDAEAIELMKPGVRIINAAHGNVLDETAVADALKEERIAGVAVDVFREEPPYSSPLIGLDKVIHTPHVGDNTVEAMQDLSIQVVHQVLDAVRDQDYRNVVNMPLLPDVDFKSIRPYMILAERMGKLVHTLARTPVNRVAVELRGDETSGLIKPMTVGVLQGLLAPIHGDKVSYVNAPIFAQEHGWVVTQAKGLQLGEYSNVIVCEVTLETGEKIAIVGTLLDRKKPHIVSINEYNMNFAPEGYMLIMGSYDQPGVIGKVGSLLAENNVNIASWQTGRSEVGGQTLTVLTLDECLSDELYQVLCELDFVRHAHQVSFENDRAL